MMDIPIVMRAMLMWILFLPVPICNGLLREFWYKKKLGDKKAHWIGSAFVSSVFVLYTYVLIGDHIGSLDVVALVGIGSLWAFMTFVFESMLGRKNGLTWRAIFADYDVRKGRVWGFVLLTIFFAPFIVRLIEIMV